MHLFLKSAVARMHSPSRRPKVSCRCLKGRVQHVRVDHRTLLAMLASNNSRNVSSRSVEHPRQVGGIRHVGVVTTRQSRRQLASSPTTCGIVGSGASDRPSRGTSLRTCGLGRHGSKGRNQRLSVVSCFASSRRRRRSEGESVCVGWGGCALRSIV